MGGESGSRDWLTVCVGMSGLLCSVLLRLCHLLFLKELVMPKNQESLSVKVVLKLEFTYREELELLKTRKVK